MRSLREYAMTAEHMERMKYLGREERQLTSKLLSEDIRELMSCDDMTDEKWKAEFMAYWKSLNTDDSLNTRAMVYAYHRRTCCSGFLAALECLIYVTDYAFVQQYVEQFHDMVMDQEEYWYLTRFILRSGNLTYLRALAECAPDKCLAIPSKWWRSSYLHLTWRRTSPEIDEVMREAQKIMSKLVRQHSKISYEQEISSE